VGQYLSLDEDGRERVRERLTSPGLEQSEAVVAWLWDHRISMIAADTPALEAYPTVADAPFPWTHPLLHPILIGLLGMALGELWNLEQLAEDCAHDGVYASMLAYKPLNLVGGVGSPANALAVQGRNDVWRISE